MLYNFFYITMNRLLASAIDSVCFVPFLLLSTLILKPPS